MTFEQWWEEQRRIGVVGAAMGSEEVLATVCSYAYQHGWMEGNLDGLKEAAAIIRGDLETLKKETH